VDNASPGPDVDTIENRLPQVQLIQCKKNLGFAGANNVGFLQSKGRNILFLNPDTELVGDAITIMLHQIERLPKAGVVGCKLLNSDGTVQLSSIRRFPKILNQIVDAEYLLIKWPDFPLWRLGPLFKDKPEPCPVDVISGACMLMKREIFEQVGMFSEDYFMYAEDLDLNYKVHRASYTNYYVGSAVITHHGGKSSGQKVNQWSTVMQYRAMVRYHRKTRGRTYELLYRFAIGLAAAARLVILGIAYPLGNILKMKASFGNAMRKWSVVFRWAIGRAAAGDR
jgi:GT2 family glycosyltransferase